MKERIKDVLLEVSIDHLKQHLAEVDKCKGNESICKTVLVEEGVEYCFLSYKNREWVFGGYYQDLLFSDSRI